MDESELEEGEACSDRNDNDDYDASIDLDVALSYLDEKIQKVLGHFQKDFEGVISVENLGAKYGGYGSFLPAYEQSPVWSHPRSPPKVQNCSTTRSPNNCASEGGHHNSLVSSTTQKNAAIYRSLGLDVSPPSSLNHSPSESEGMSPFESLSAILQEKIMTSFPVHGDLLVSPLSHGLESLNMLPNGLLLDWLRNRCSVTKEETTKALIVLCQVPTPESQTNMHSNLGGVITGVTLANLLHPDQNHQNIGSHALPCGGKKKDGLKEPSDAKFKDGPHQLSNSMKKNLLASAKGRSLNDVSQSALMGEPDFQQQSKSSDVPVKKHKEKQKVRENYSDGGDTKNLRMKSRKDNSDQDCSIASKKIKTEVMHFTGHNGPTGKMGPSANSGFSTALSEKDQPRYNERSSFKDPRDDATGSLHVSVKKVKHTVPVSLEMGTSDDRENSKKRKVKEFNNGDDRKEKKLRVSKSEGKESRASRDSGRTDKKGSHAKIHQLGKDLESNVSQRSLDGMDSLRRDLGSLQPSTAATSSSSKVSSSHKTKAIFQEVKGSPVESCPRKSAKVSSSRLKDKNRSFKTDFDMGKVKISDSVCDLQDHSPSHEVKPRDGKNQLQEKFGIKSDVAENKYVSKKDPAGKLSSESSERQSQIKLGEHDGPHIKVDSTCRPNALSTTKQNLPQDCDGERSSKRFPSDKTDQFGLISGRGKSKPLPLSGGPQIETLNHGPRPVIGSHIYIYIYIYIYICRELHAPCKRSLLQGAGSMLRAREEDYSNHTFEV